MKADWEQTTEYLQSLQAIRIECDQVYRNIDHSQYYQVDESQLALVADAIQELIHADYNDNPALIKPHSRWRHTPSRYTDGLDGDQLVDLFTVSVLLDAGAGNDWTFCDADKAKTTRSEGIAVAVAVAFHAGLFSGDRRGKQVDSRGLQNITRQDMMDMFQVTDTNRISGLEGRVELMRRLGRQLQASPVFANNERPSGMLTYIRNHHHHTTVDVEWFWRHVIVNGFNAVWPEGGRLKVAGESLGDVHHCQLTGRLVPFHKLSQWLCYSLLEALEQRHHFTITNGHLQTGLAEYRNGGLFLDYNVIVPKFDVTDGAPFTPNSEQVVQWRALTVCLLDKLHQQYFGGTLTLPQLLEAGTWKAGRLIARAKRQTGCPPIDIASDGTLF